MRDVSLTFLQAALAQETGEAPVALITINHASLLGGPIRLAGYDVDIVSRGNTYVAFPFRLTMPNDRHAGAPRARLSVDNIDLTMVRTVRAMTGAPPTVTIEIVLASSPDIVEASFPDFVLRNVNYDHLVIEGDVTLDLLASEPFPAGRFRPGAFPAVH